jgi:hypothetical protein
MLVEEVDMFQDSKGPIEAFSWGRFLINGEIHAESVEGVGKDICIVDGQVTAWKARKGHRLKPKMVACVLDHDVDILIIGNGVNGAIKVLKKTQETIIDHGIQKLIIKTTPEACQMYNQMLLQGEKVALLAHGTC